MCAVGASMHGYAPFRSRRPHTVLYALLVVSSTNHAPPTQPPPLPTRQGIVVRLSCVHEPRTGSDDPGHIVCFRETHVYS